MSSISVIVVTMGESPVLERCLAAIAAGDRRPDEVVLVDGTGTFQSVAESLLAAAGVPLRYVPVERTGTSRARNLGAAAAGSDLLAFTDDDCVPDARWLAAYEAVTAALGVEAASGRVLPLDEGGRRLLAVSLRTATVQRIVDEDTAVAPWDIGTGASMFVSAAAFREVGGFDESFGPGARYRAAEDIDLFERLMRARVRVVYTPDAVVFHQMKDRRGWLRRQVPYGIGMGALIRRAPSGRRAFLAGAYGRMLATTALSGIRSRSWQPVAETMLMGTGFLRGYLRALMTRGEDPR
jgi:O-antigen biosynthesis protein